MLLEAWLGSCQIAPKMLPEYSRMLFAVLVLHAIVQLQFFVQPHNILKLQWQ